MQSAFVDCIFCSVSIVEINYGLAHFRSGNKVTQKPNFPSRIKKFGQPFQRLWVWAMPTKAVSYHKFLIAKQLSCLAT